MSQVSPDGQYVVTSIEVPGTKGQRVTDRIYQGLYDFWGFGQVFYPTRGILAWYSKATAETAAASRRRRSRLRADLRFLESRPKLHRIRQGQGARSLSARAAGVAIRQRSQRNPDSIRPISHPVQQRQGRQGGTDRGRVGKRHEQQLSQGFARRQVDRVGAKQERAVDAARQQALHRAFGRRGSAPVAQQSAKP